MKTPIVILSAVCLALVATLFMRNRSTGVELQTSATNQMSLSNEVAQFRVRLVDAQVKAMQMQTNLQGMLDRRTKEFLAASNLVVQLRTTLAGTREELTKAQGEVGAKSTTLTALETQRDDLSRRVEVVPGLEKQLADAKQNLGYVLADRETLMKERQRLQLENADLQRKIGDLDFLRLQTVKLEDEVQARKRLANARPGSSPDLKLPLVLQDDGSVRLVSPPETPAPR